MGGILFGLLGFNQFDLIWVVLLNCIALLYEGPAWAMEGFVTLGEDWFWLA